MNRVATGKERILFVSFIESDSYHNSRTVLTPDGIEGSRYFLSCNTFVLCFIFDSDMFLYTCFFNTISVSLTGRDINNSL